jgi:hypothetical protein
MKNRIKKEPRTLAGLVRVEDQYSEANMMVSTRVCDHRGRDAPLAVGLPMCLHSAPPRKSAGLFLSRGEPTFRIWR